MNNLDQEARYIQYVKSLEDRFGASVDIDFENRNVFINCSDENRLEIAKELNEFFGDYLF